MYTLLMIHFTLMMIIMILIIINWFMSKNFLKSIFEKNSPFECGFEPFESSRLPFSIQFYLISILFLIFDIEIILLLPMINSLKIINYLNWMYSSLIILMILFLGLEFEKNEGIFNWFLT